MGIEMQLKGSKKGISRTPLVQTKGKKISSKGKRVVEY